MDVVNMSFTEGIITEGMTNTTEAILCAVWQLEHPVKVTSPPPPPTLCPIGLHSVPLFEFDFPCTDLQLTQKLE